MKRPYELIVLTLLLAACSPAASVSAGEPLVAPYTPPREITTESLTDDPVLNGISAMISSGPHAEKFACQDCHDPAQDHPGGRLIWVNPANGEQESMATPTELCVKCHSAKASAAAGEAAKHADTVCTDCHNPHSTQASCTQSSCHSDIRNSLTAQIEPPAGHTATGDPNTSYMCGGAACHAVAKQVAGIPVYHQPVHNKVPCEVCHDGSGMTISGGGDLPWTTVNASGEAVTSHQIELAVDCSRCHFAGNPRGLMEAVSPDAP